MFLNRSTLGGRERSGSSWSMSHSWSEKHQQHNSCRECDCDQLQTHIPHWDGKRQTHQRGIQETGRVHMYVHTWLCIIQAHTDQACHICSALALRPEKLNCRSVRLVTMTVHVCKVVGYRGGECGGFNA